MPRNQHCIHIHYFHGCLLCLLLSTPRHNHCATPRRGLQIKLPPIRFHVARCKVPTRGKFHQGHQSQLRQLPLLPPLPFPPLPSVSFPPFSLTSLPCHNGPPKPSYGTWERTGSFVVHAKNRRQAPRPSTANTMRQHSYDRHLQVMIKRNVKLNKWHSTIKTTVYKLSKAEKNL